MDDAASEADQLRSTISEQELNLEKLKERYVSLALSESDTTDESQELAQQIQDLSNELNANRQRLSDAENAADRLDNSLEDVDDAARQADDSFTVFKATLANLAADAIRAAVDGLKNLAGSVIDLGQNFTGTMSEVQSISGASGDELETLEACAREFGATTTFSASEAAEALKYMALAGWDVDQSTSALGGVLNLAAASGMELGAASDMVTDYLSAFGMEAEQAAYLADMLASAQASSNTSAEALGEAYKNCAANLNAAGQDVETVTSLLEGMANQGYKGSEAGTAMAAIMRDITNAMDKGKIKIGDTSVAVMDAEGNFRDLTDILTEVEAATNGMGDAERAIALSSTFTADSTKGLNLILNEGMGNIAGYEESLRAAGGTAEEMAAIMNDNLTGDLAQMNSAWEELGLKIYSEFEEPLRSAVQFVTTSVIPGIEWLLGHLPEVGAALGVLGVIIAALKWNSIATQLGKLSSLFSGFKTVLAAIPGPVLAIVAVVAAGFAYLWNTNEDFRDNVIAVWEELQSSFSELGGKISAMLNQLMPLISEIASTVLTAFGQIAEAVLPVLIQIIAEILPVFIAMIGQLLPLVIQIVETVLPMLLQLVQTLLPIIIQIVEAVLPILIQLINAILPIIMQIISVVLPVLVEILNALTPILNMVISLLQPILDLIVSLVEPILNLIMTAIAPLIDIFATLLSTILQPIMPILNAVANIITSVLGAAIQAIQPIIQSLISIFQGLIDFITGVFSGNWSQAWNSVVQVFGGLWDGLVAIVKAPINAVIGLINGAINGLNSISVTIPDWVPVVGGNTFGIDIPTIPMLATGGFTDGVSIAGEAGMEAVISFDKRYHNENVAIWEKAGQMLGTLGTSAGESAGLTSTAGKLLTLDDFSLGSLANDASTVIYYDFSGFTWSPQIQTGNTGDDTNNFMAQLRAHEAEFFDWLEEFIQMREVAQYA